MLNLKDRWWNELKIWFKRWNGVKDVSKKFCLVENSLVEFWKRIKILVVGATLVDQNGLKSGFCLSIF